MGTTRDDINRWIATGIRNGHKYLVSVCDTFEYTDYPVYCDNEEELSKARAKYDGQNMQKINEVLTLAEHWEDGMLKDLKSILSAIKGGYIDAGINKTYCFVTNEDGDLYFLKRDDKNSEAQKDLDNDGEVRDQWPINHYDGKVIFKKYCGENRGVDIAESFLNAMEIEYLG